MTYLLDTNVVSEAMQLRPSPEVLAWVAGQPAPSLFLSAVTIGEIDFGIARIEPGGRRERYRRWRDDLISAAGRRILAVDLTVAALWGEVRARTSAIGRPMPVLDALLAATAEAHELILVTRNARDFQAWGGRVLNPWP